MNEEVSPMLLQSYLHRLLVRIRGALHNIGKIFERSVAIRQDLLQRMLRRHILLIEVGLPRPPDDLVVNVRDVHDIENVVAKVVL